MHMAAKITTKRPALIQLSYLFVFFDILKARNFRKHVQMLLLQYKAIYLGHNVLFS